MGGVSLAWSLVLALCCGNALAAKLSGASKFPTQKQIFDAARAIDCTGIRLETFANHCSSRGQNPGCADPNDVCFVKSGTHSQCRPRDRTLPTCWDSVEAVYCKGDKKPVPFSGTLKGRGCEPRPAKIAKATDGKKERRKAAEAPHEPTPGDPEGTNCKKSDMAKGCECAGKFWRCADKDDLITKACDIGLECVRKNEFYAVCATPARKKWAKEVAGWEGTAVPCGVNVGLFGFSSSGASPGGFNTLPSKGKKGHSHTGGGGGGGSKKGGKKGH